MHPWSQAFYGLRIDTWPIFGWVGACLLPNILFMHIVLILCICTMLMLYKYVRVFSPTCSQCKTLSAWVCLYCRLSSTGHLDGGSGLLRVLESHSITITLPPFCTDEMQKVRISMWCLLFVICEITFINMYVWDHVMFNYHDKCACEYQTFVVNNFLNARVPQNVYILIFPCRLWLDISLAWRVLVNNLQEWLQSTTCCFGKGGLV